jgi:hypothetical protein
MTAQALSLVHNHSAHTGSKPGSLTFAIPTVLICDHPLLRSGLQQILSGSCPVA